VSTPEQHAERVIRAWHTRGPSSAFRRMRMMHGVDARDHLVGSTESPGD
jgi:hypothetical protein